MILEKYRSLQAIAGASKTTVGVRKQEFNRGVYDYIVATDEGSGTLEADSDSDSDGESEGEDQDTHEQEERKFFSVFLTSSYPSTSSDSYATKCRRK